MEDEGRVINVYSKSVKVTGWDDDVLAKPYDNYPYDPCKRNYGLSTYKRFGIYDVKSPISETRELQQQVLSSSITAKICTPARATAKKEWYRESCQYILREGTGIHPMDYFITDYTSSNKYDYRHPSPHLEKPFQPDLSPPPAIYGKLDFCIKEGSISKFWDDDLCKAKKCYPDQAKAPPHVNLDIYYGRDPNKKSNNVQEQLAPQNSEYERGEVDQELCNEILKESN